MRSRATTTRATIVISGRPGDAARHLAADLHALGDTLLTNESGVVAAAQAGGVVAVVLDASDRPPDTVSAVIRALARTSDAVLLVLLAGDAAPAIPQLLDAGADDVLCRPVLRAELCARLRAHLRRRRHD